MVEAAHTLDGAVEAAITVAEVTLLEDRGLVTRRGRVNVPPGRSRLRVEGVAPVLVDKTLAARVSDPNGGELPDGLRVRDVRIERWRVTQEADRPAALAEVQTQIRGKEAERAAVEHDARSLEAEAIALASLEQLTLGEIAEDVAWAKQDAARWEAQLEQLGARQAQIAADVCERLQQLQEIDRDLADLRRLAAARDHLDARAAAALVVELVNPDAQAHAVDVRIDYVVPGAAWRPWHAARLVEEGDEARVELRTEGCVWQSTGEDWHDVQIVFSTERPSLGVSPPTLHTDRVSAFKRGSAVEVQTREQKIHAAGLGGEESGAVQIADDVPGIDDGGEALELRGRTRVSVPTDGRPHRVPITSFVAPAEVALACTPELQPAVLLRTRQINRGEFPLLAGPVDLIRDSGLVGRTSILFIAKGERFELGFGPDPSLRVTREVEYLDQERRTLSSWTRKPRKVTLKLSNIGPVARTIEVKERIAVSEIEKVEVELGETAPKATADKDGFVEWSVRLLGLGHETLTLHWTLVVHDDVVGL
jgi:uncharacterized protein (TIGR02231 family)